jgi:MFS family permease
VTGAMTTSTGPPEGSFLATGRGKVTLSLLCLATFLDVMDGAIVNVAMPTIRAHLGFSVQNLQWVISGYLITYGGFLLLGGRALSILTTTFQGPDMHKALGVWAGISGMASAVGLLIGGTLTQELGWRWVFFISLPLAAVVLFGTFRPGRFGRAHDRLPAQRATARPSAGPVVDLPGQGLAAADATQMIAWAGFWSMFFFITLYMRNVLGFTPLETGLSYVPVSAGIGSGSAVATKMFVKTGTRPFIVGGSLLSAGGIVWLSRIPVDGSYLGNLLVPLVIMGIGLGLLYAGVQTAANAGVPPEKAGLAAALITASFQLGSALGLAVFSGIATTRTTHLLATHTPAPQALTEGFQRGLLASALCLAAAAAIALRAPNTHGLLLQRHFVIM